jgi:hypothetical protein
MANQPAKQVDVLGFDRMEIANVRRCYGANKVNYSKLNKLYEKATALKDAIDSLTESIKVWDAPARKLALEKVGVELSSEEILLAHTEPAKFFELHPELRPAQPEEAPAEEATDEGPTI